MFRSNYLVLLVLFAVWWSSEPSHGDVGTPLLLTELIHEGRLQEARAAASVAISGFEDIESYSGYFTVNDLFQSNMFFWFFPSRNDPENDPVVLWLQGGPGSSAMLGIFIETGPFYAINNTSLGRREYPWNANHSILYVDNPVGTGYSFTKAGYALNQTQVGKELYECLQQFFTLFPNLQANDFIIAGESYAGKYAPAIAYTIMKNNPDAKLKINLQGICLGNPLVDPINQFRFGDYLYQIGLIDNNTLQIFLEYEEKARTYMKNGDYDAANKVFSYLINTNEVPSLFENATGITDPYNYLNDEIPWTSSYKDAISFLQSEAMRSALHTGNVTFGDSEVRRLLDIDMMKSVAPWVNELLDRYRMLFYGGQLDVMVPYTPMLEMLHKFEFSGAEEYQISTRSKLYYNGKIYGYLKKGGNLFDVLVRDSGHLLPYDKPAQVYDLIYKFARNQL